MTNNTKVYFKQGGDVLVVADGGSIDIQGGTLTANGEAASAIPDAETDHALSSEFSNTEANAALDALGGSVNAILAALRAAGIVASS